MRARSSLFLAIVFLVASFVSPACAQEHDHWHDRDIRHFHEHDFGIWRGGRWFHGFHGGRGGWWWIVGDGWYFYPTPVYPYPDPYLPPAVVAGPPPPPGVYTAPPEYTYYCPSPAGYYPYVPQCYGPWQRVGSSGVVVQSPAYIVQPSAAAPIPAPAPQQQQAMVPLSMPVPHSTSDSQRELDDRQLNAYGAEFPQISPQDPKARAKLKALAAQVEAFRQTLFLRNYNAMDILRDAENLENRIKAARAKTGAHKTISPAVPMQPPAAVIPTTPAPLSSPPPGQ